MAKTELRNLKMLSRRRLDGDTVAAVGDVFAVIPADRTQKEARGRDPGPSGPRADYAKLEIEELWAVRWVQQNLAEWTDDKPQRAPAETADDGEGGTAGKAGKKGKRG